MIMRIKLITFIFSLFYADVYSMYYVSQHLSEPHRHAIMIAQNINKSIQEVEGITDEIRKEYKTLTDYIITNYADIQQNQDVCSALANYILYFKKRGLK